MTQKAEVLKIPPPHYPTKKSLTDIIETSMGTSTDPDIYLKREADPTDQDKLNRDAHVKAVIIGSLN